MNLCKKDEQKCNSVLIMFPFIICSYACIKYVFKDTCHGEKGRIFCSEPCHSFLSVCGATTSTINNKIYVLVCFFFTLSSICLHDSSISACCKLWTLVEWWRTQMVIQLINLHEIVYQTPLANRSVGSNVFPAVYVFPLFFFHSSTSGGLIS